MGKKSAELCGISSILRKNAVDLVVFGAIQYQMINNPGLSIDDIIKNVLPTFNITHTTPGAVKIAFLRTRAAFVESNGI